MLQYYIETLIPGLFLGETSEICVLSRDPKKVTITEERAVAFRFFEREESIVEGEVLKGRKKNYSGWYYIKGTALTLQEVEATMPNQKILISNMKSNNWDRVINLPTGQTYPLEKEDIVL